VSTNMGNLEKLGILVIVILVVVVGVVAITPKSTVDERLYPDGERTEMALAPEVLEPVPPATGALAESPWPAKEGATASSDLKPLPAPIAPTATPVVPEPTFRTVKIQRGDTFAIIAKRELGSSARYKELVDANPGLTATKLVAGKEIRIPVAAASPAPSTPAVVDPFAPTAAPVAPVADEKTYVVRKGDTLSSIASREMGATNKWGELAKANEDVLHGSTALKIGMKLRIPSGSSAPESGGVVASRNLAPSAGGEHEYVVQPGDSLWSIAKHEMGSETLLKDLRAANDDVLKGGDALKVGMKLKIPAKR
jgi:nucleoid-associated protein YgaU